jgi:hypothetical protein
LLNAARRQGLAARTRTTLLAQGGWTGIRIGNAILPRRRSVILYPLAHREAAIRIAGQFGFPLSRRTTGREIVILLGSDAARIPTRRATG